MENECPDVAPLPQEVIFSDAQKELLSKLLGAIDKLDSTLFTSGFIVAEDQISRRDINVRIISGGIKNVKDSIRAAIDGSNPDDETRTLPFDAVDLVGLHCYIQGVMDSLKGADGIITKLSVDFLKVKQGQTHRHQLLNKQIQFGTLANKVLMMIEDHPQFDREIAEEMGLKPAERKKKGGSLPGL